MSTGGTGWRHLEASILIDAPPAAVWEVLTDAQRYPAWSPFVVALDPGHADGLTVGAVAQLTVRMNPARDKTLQSPEQVLTLDPGRRLSWRYVGLPAWLLNAARHQDLEAAAGGGTRYRTHQTYRGPLSWFVLGLYRARILAGFQATAEALKVRAEALAAPAPRAPRDR